MTDKMNTEEFEKILDNRLNKIVEGLKIKGKEYCRNGDRLHNFNQGARIGSQTRERILWKGFALKHLISIDDMINDLDEGILPTEEQVDEKLGDVTNYTILLEACFKQRINKLKNKKFYEKD